MIIPLVLFSLGLVMLVGSFFTVRKNQRLSHDGITTDGTVIEVQQVISTDQEGNETESYYPLFQFTTGTGVVYKVRSKVAGSQNTYRVGQTVPVVYLDDEPHKAKINRKGELYTGPILLGCFGGISLIAAIVIALRHHGG